MIYECNLFLGVSLKSKQIAFPTTFTHNLAGQIKTRTDVVDTPAGTRTDSYQYFYDNRNRLEQVKLNNIVIEEYDYDSNGNRSD